MKRIVGVVVLAGLLCAGPSSAQNSCSQEWKYIAFAPNGIPLPQGPFCTYSDCYKIQSQQIASESSVIVPPAVMPAPTLCWNAWAQTFPTPKPTPTP